MPIELCNPQARSNGLLFLAKKPVRQKYNERALLLFSYNLTKQKKGDVAGDKEVWDTYIYTLEQVEEKQQTLWA